MTTWGNSPGRPPGPPKASGQAWAIVLLIFAIGVLVGVICL